MLACVALLVAATGLQAPQCNPAQKLQTRRHVAAVQTSSSETRTCSCRFCGAAFQSKNAMFRHLREYAPCAAAAAAEDPRATAAIAERRRHVATYLVGYGAGRGADAEAVLASLCGATSITRATAVGGRSAALALGTAAAARDVVSVVADRALPGPAQLNADLPQDIRVLGARPGRVHAESAATQRAFHYLLPLRWLAGADRAGAERVEDGATAGETKFGVKRPAHAPRSDTSSALTRRALRELKTALRAAVNTTGAWHNFADPELRGLLSPFAAATRTRLHRARAADTLVLGGEPFVVIEVRGRGFLPQQARRLIGVAVLMQRGELPADAFEILTRRDVVLATPLPPPLEYFAGARYSALEVKGSDEWPEDGGAADAWLTELREELIEKSASDEWLRTFDACGLGDAIGAARRYGHDEAPSTSSDVVVAATPTPPAYAACLSELRAAHDSGRWPRTSIARSKLIRPTDTAASFTVERPPSQARGNLAFPRLAEAVFALEQEIAPDRPPSTHCAVNRRAEFAPHVDSGRGLGQSTSLIVGLGDFSGGELAVEGVEHDVRYAPLEFDGWGERHWTLPFNGERYSLVWFTPAEARERTSADARAAEVLGTKEFRYRPDTSDALAILEVLGSECYGAPPPFPGGQVFDFDPAGRSVLDGGAHIGAFSEWARDASSIVAVEPEPSNAALYRQNHPDVQLIEAALTETSEAVTLVVAPNTWRHAVEDVTHYAGGERIAVESVAFDGLLATGVDWVKLDIEGAEMKLLAKPRDWRGVDRLVVEWSFTKDRALAPFLEALGHLRAAGFVCAYDGRGTWDQVDIWPGRTDALVFCSRDL